MTTSSSGKGKNVIIIILLLIIVGLISLIVYARAFAAIAKVNGESIPRVKFVQEMEKQSGQKVIDTLINRTLIYQAAESKNITVSDKEIKDETKKIEDSIKSQKTTLDKVLKAQNLTQSDLNERIKLNKLSQKLVEKKTSVTEKEIDDYIARNPNQFQELPVSKQLREQIKEQLKQQKINSQVQLLLTNLRKESKIQIYFP